MSYSDEKIRAWAEGGEADACNERVARDMARDLARDVRTLRQRSLEQQQTIEALQRKLDTREKLDGMIGELRVELEGEQPRGVLTTRRRWRALVMRAARKWRDAEAGHKAVILGELYQRIGGELESREPIPGWEQALKAAVALLETGR